MKHIENDIEKNYGRLAALRAPVTRDLFAQPGTSEDLTLIGERVHTLAAPLPIPTLATSDSMQLDFFAP